MAYMASWIKSPPKGQEANRPQHVLSLCTAAFQNGTKAKPFSTIIYYNILYYNTIYCQHHVMPILRLPTDVINTLRASEDWRARNSAWPPEHVG